MKNNEEMIVLEIFNAMADEVLMHDDLDRAELNQLCSALSLDLQLARENNYKRKVFGEA